MEPVLSASHGDGRSSRPGAEVQEPGIPRGLRETSQVALDVRREVNSHPLVSRYFRVLGADEMIPAEFRSSGFADYLSPDVDWAKAVKALNEDEFALDATRLTLVCGAAGFDGTQF